MQWLVEEYRFLCSYNSCLALGLAAVAGCVISFRIYLNAQAKHEHDEMIAQDFDTIRVVLPEEVLGGKPDLERGLPEEESKNDN